MVSAARSLPGVFHLLLLIGLWGWVSPAAGYQIPPAWASSIDSALDVRDAYYSAILQNTTPVTSQSLSPVLRGALCARLTGTPEPDNPWYHFLSGLSNCAPGKDSARFATALSLARGNPGTAWVLFAEFSRSGFTAWADRCLVELEQQKVASGARSVPLIARQLIYHARDREEQKDIAGATSLYRWAGRFDQGQGWTIIRSTFLSPAGLFTAFGPLTDLMLHSWPLQLDAAAHFYTWLRSFFLVFMIIVLIGTGLKYAPRALHRFTDRLPVSLPAWLRTFLPLAVLLSTIAFGLIPFFWLLLLLIYPFVDRRERPLLIVTALLLVLAPLDSRVRTLFVEARLPGESPALYTRATQEPYLPEVHRLARAKTITDRFDVLSYLSDASCASKRGDTAAVNRCLKRALELRPDDPVVLCQAGNAAYAVDDMNKAATFYQRILSLRAGTVEARYNLARCYARKSDASMDLDFLKFFPLREQKRVDDFHRSMTAAFGATPPLSRQVMTLEYRPREFWFSLLPTYGGSWAKSSVLWGVTFFGIAALPSLFIGFVLFLLLLVRQAVAKRRKKPLSACRLCRRIICKKCMSEELCPSCHHATKFNKNVKTLAVIQSRIVRNRTRRMHLTENLLDIILPGSGMLYADRFSTGKIIGIVTLTSALYATFLLASRLALVYPHGVLFGLTEYAPAVVVYNVLFLVRALATQIRKRRRTVLA